MSVIEVRMAPEAVEVRVNVRRQPYVRAVVERVAEKTGLSREVVESCLDDPTLDEMQVLGSGYVTDMVAARDHVIRLREKVHSFYEQAAEGRPGGLDPTEAAATFTELRDALLEISDPERWTRQHGRSLPEPPAQAATAPPQPPKPPEPPGPPGGGSGPPPGEPPHPADPARWERNRESRRIRALDEAPRRALERARELQPDLVDRALRGEPAALPALRVALRGRLSAAEIGAVSDAVAAVRQPDLGYALGAGTLGLGRGPFEAQGAYHRLPGPQQEAVAAAVAADPEFVRTMVTAEVHYGPRRGVRTPWRPEEMNRFCAENGVIGEERANLEAGLLELNRRHLGAQVEPTPGGGRSTTQARTRAATVDATARRLGLPTANELAARLRRESVVLDLARSSPEQLHDLATRWLEYATEKQAAGKPAATLERYIGYIMRSHMRGLLGELSAVFALGKDAWVLKMPDLRVTDPGTDFVVVMKSTGELWFADNKALSRPLLTEVSSLLKNGAENIARDAREFGPSGAPSPVAVPEPVADAIARAHAAGAALEALASGKSPAELNSEAFQQQVTRICDQHGIRRVVTNAGGDLTWLSDRLQRSGIDMVDLNDPARVPPTRPLTAPEAPPATAPDTAAPAEPGAPAAGPDEPGDAP